MYASLSYRTKTDFFDVICVTVVLRVITMASTSFLMPGLLEFTWPCLRSIRTAEDNEITASAGTRLACLGMASMASVDSQVACFMITQR